MRRFTLSSILLTVFAVLVACKSSPPPPPATGRADSAPVMAERRGPEAAVRSEPEGLGSSAADAPNGALAKDGRPLIVCFGDSLTAGYGADPGESYPDFLQRLLDASGGAKYRVVNEGVSGNTTKDGIARVARVVSLHPAVVVVEFGGNDGLRGLPIADTRANLDHILSALVKSGAKVAIAGITLPPDYGPDYIAQFNAIYPDLARRYRVPYIPFLLRGVFGTPGMMQQDGIHATAAGNEVVARTVEQLIRPLLGR